MYVGIIKNNFVYIYIDYNIAVLSIYIYSMYQ